jgi:DNA invertase Pin-like site-specific DNA recombinase
MPSGYDVVDEIAEEMSGRKQDTEGLERIRDLADSGKVEAVLVHKWNRLARTVARFESFMLEMKLAGVDVVSLDGQSNATATGRMFNRMMAVFSEYQRDDLVATMRQGKIGRARIRGRSSRGVTRPTGSSTTRGPATTAWTRAAWSTSGERSAWSATKARPSARSRRPSRKKACRRRGAGATGTPGPYAR